MKLAYCWQAKFNKENIYNTSKICYVPLTGAHVAVRHITQMVATHILVIVKINLSFQRSEADSE